MECSDGCRDPWLKTLSQHQFYLDNLEDELTITALRILVKDLLILFQAVNEGVINILGKRRAFFASYRRFLNSIHSQRATLKCHTLMPPLL